MRWLVQRWLSSPATRSKTPLLFFAMALLPLTADELVSTTRTVRKRLDLTVEAVMLQDRWRYLFSEQERDIARQRLQQYGYEFE